LEELKKKKALTSFKGARKKENRRLHLEDHTLTNPKFFGRWNSSARKKGGREDRPEKPGPKERQLLGGGLLTF